MGSVHSINTSAELERFFDYLFGDQTGYAYSPIKNPETGDFAKHFFSWPTDRQGLIDHVNRFAPTHEVYYAPALFKSPGAEKTDFKGTNFVWCEFDGSLPADITGVPEPTLKIRSSTSDHEHWYWRLENFVTDISIVENISQRLAYHLQADLSCWNANRVLRPPTTTHHESTRTVTVLKWESEPTAISSFVGLPELPMKMLQDTDINFVPLALNVIAKYSWGDKEFEFFTEKTIPVGHRSAALTKLGHICMEMGMSNAETLAILLNADNRWKKFHKRKDQTTRLLGIINFCRARHPVDVVEEQVEQESTGTLKVYTWEEFKNTEVTIEWAIPGLIHKKGLAMIAGPPGVGKSQMTLRFAERMAKGEKFLKWTPERPMKTIFISMEMPHEELHYITEQMRIEGDEDLLRENFLILPIGSSIMLGKPKAREDLRRVMEEFQPDGVFLDSLGVAIGDELSSDKIILENFDFIKRVVQNEYGAFAWWIHHYRKAQVGNRKPNKLEDLYGSQYIGAAVTTGIGLWPSGPNLEVSCLKLRMAEQFKQFNIKREPNIDFSVIENKVLADDTPIMGGLGGLSDLI